MRAVALGLCAATLALASAMPAAAAPAVQVIVDEVTYPVSHRSRNKPNYAPQSAPKLKGKSKYTTRRVVLKNERLEVHVLPELGGRLVRAIHTPPGGKPIDLFWRHDRIDDGVSWSMGGGRFSFPFFEHGRHFDETGGYTITKHNDGSVTLAIDMRFEHFVNPAETRRYGRAANLRLAQYIHFKPGEAKFTWTGRVENFQPIRHGFKLWFLLRQPNAPGITAILPAPGVTDHGAPKLMDWPVYQPIGPNTQMSRFGIGITQPFMGWHIDRHDLNVMAIVDRSATPGGKIVMYPTGKARYIELWGGSHEVFEECGNFLPAFGRYTQQVTIVPSVGIGQAGYANAHATINAKRTDAGWRIALVPTMAMVKGQLVVSAGDTVSKHKVNAQAGEAVVIEDKQIDVDRVRIALIGDDGANLVAFDAPLDVGPSPVKRFGIVQTQCRGTQPGGKGAFAEAADLVSEHSPTLYRMAGTFGKQLREGSDDGVATARRLLRVRAKSTDVAAALTRHVTRHSDDAHARLLLGLWLTEADKHALAGHSFAKATAHPGGAYMMALAHWRKSEQDRAMKLLAQAIQAKPTDTFAANDASAALLHPAATSRGSTLPLTRAVWLQAMGQTDEANEVLRKLVADDPALIEAWMLLKDAAQLKTLRDRNPRGYQLAEQRLKAISEASWYPFSRP